MKEMTWLVKRLSDGKIVSDTETEPEDIPGHEKFEWFGPYEVYSEGYIEPDGTEVPTVAGEDPRPGGYTSHRIEMENLESTAENEQAWLETVIPNIDSMDAAEVRAVVKRLAQENLAMIKAWRYVLDRLLGTG